MVVDNQPLQSCVNYTSPYSEVTMSLVSPFPPHDNDIQVRRQSWQTLGKGGHILWQVDYMSVLTLWQPLQRHDGHLLVSVPPVCQTLCKYYSENKQHQVIVFISLLTHLTMYMD